MAQCAANLRLALPLRRKIPRHCRKKCIALCGTLFLSDFGAVRCDDPGGSAAAMCVAVQRSLAPPDATRIPVCHDTKAPGRDECAWQTTSCAQKARYVQAGAGQHKAAFVALRAARVASLAMPRLIVTGLQFHMGAGHWLPAETNGKTCPEAPVKWL